MKNHSFLAIISLFFLGAFFRPCSVMAQKESDSARQRIISEMINGQQYRFIAQTMLPLNGRQRQLDSQYDLLVSKDQVVADLPYFGTAYFSPGNAADAGIQFTSKQYDYQLTPRKKDGWEILIRCKDLADPQNLNLTVFSNGNASLQVTCNRRQSISFNGYITAPDKKK